jgi:hypothetical protein
VLLGAVYLDSFRNDLGDCRCYIFRSVLGDCRNDIFRRF